MSVSKDLRGGHMGKVQICQVTAEVKIKTDSQKLKHLAKQEDFASQKELFVSRVAQRWNGVS